MKIEMTENQILALLVVMLSAGGYLSGVLAVAFITWTVPAWNVADWHPAGRFLWGVWCIAWVAAAVGESS